MKVGELDQRSLRRQLAHGDFLLTTGPFVTRIRSSLPKVAAGIAHLYADYECPTSDEFADFHVSVARPRSLRGIYRPQVCFEFDGREPFRRMRLDQAFPMLEWGLNWCVYSNAHHYLMIHAAVVARGDHALILPAPPGSGKSTLCAGLVANGWRLLSDEMALLQPADGLLVPMPRPVGLKNESIGVIRKHAPDAVIGPPVHDTIKGTVAHMKPPKRSVELSGQHALPAWVIFPRYVAQAPYSIKPRSKGRSFIEIAENSFNYNILGATGFRLLGDLIDACDCYDLAYGRLDEAVAQLNELPLPEAGPRSP